jgi:hypothetical protein
MSDIKDNLLQPLIDSIKEENVPTKNRVSMAIADPYFPQGTIKKSESYENETPLMKSFLNLLGPEDTIERLAFEQDPDYKNQFQSVYIGKVRLLPDDMLKRVSIQDDLVAAIVDARASQISAFGRPQPDRFSTGYKIEPEPGLFETLSDSERNALQERIKRAEARLLTCGKTNGWNDNKELNFGQFLYMTGRDASVFGRMAVETLWTGLQGNKEFHSFRPIDAGTIYTAAPYREETESVRKQAFNILSQMKNKKLVPERFMNDEYAYVQVIKGTPRQAFTSDECLVHNFYPSTHVELNGYPITPLDTVISAVVTHVNITTHNKLYFQNGRAARGMLVISSDGVTKEIVGGIKQQFNASINSVSNSYRMPVFGVGTNDKITWVPIDNSTRDMEFQYLSDSNARVILSAFKMSPEELPGYTHLSRGTNSQALSESSNEYKLEAHRDVGMRPFLSHFQNFVNQKLLPLIDEELSKVASFKFVGIDAETAEKEAARIGAEINIHLTMDDILEKVQKSPIGEGLGGKIILNPAWQNAVAPYLHVGYIREHVFGVKGASKDPEFAYCRDPMWFQWQNMLLQQQQMQQQQQQAQAQAAQGGGQAQMTSKEPQPGQPGQQAGNSQEAGPSDLSSGIDQATMHMTKSESTLPKSKKTLIEEQKKILQHFLDGWENDSKELVDEIVNSTKAYVKKKKNES